MKKFIYSVLTTGIILIAANVSKAQFEGKILYSAYQVDSNGEKENQDQFTVFVTPERILLQGENKYNFIGNIKTEGVLVRMDFEDFVFLTGGDEALKISRTDITSLMNMFGNDRKKKTAPDVNYKQTGETKKIQGYTCEKFVFADEENPEHYSEVWMTKELNINWGMLTESWNDSQDMLGGDLPLNLVFEDGYLPIRVESYDNGDLTGTLEATEISKSGIARAMVQVPSGVNVLSFQDYLFQKMSRQ